jgi:hypothetical protein
MSSFIIGQIEQLISVLSNDLKSVVGQVNIFSQKFVNLELNQVSDWMNS